MFDIEKNIQLTHLFDPYYAWNEGVHQQRTNPRVLRLPTGNACLFWHREHLYAADNKIQVHLKLQYKLAFKQKGDPVTQGSFSKSRTYIQYLAQFPNNDTNC